MGYWQCTGGRRTENMCVTNEPRPVFRVVNMKDDPYYWYLALTVLCLGFEGVFTLAIKETQEWKFFCPSVFLYLARSVRQCDTLFRCLDIRVPQSQY